MSEFTRIVNAITDGDQKAADQLLPLVYEELRRLATAKMAREANETRQPTALVHEAYLRLVGNEDVQRWDGRGHFFAAASEAMRRILVDRARKRLSKKQGGNLRKHSLHDELAIEHRPDEVVDVHEALDELETVDPDAAQLVKLRYFVGLSVVEASTVLGISERSAHRDWAFARAWLAKNIEKDKTN